MGWRYDRRAGTTCQYREQVAEYQTLDVHLVAFALETRMVVVQRGQLVGSRRKALCSNDAANGIRDKGSWILAGRMQKYVQASSLI